VPGTSHNPEFNFNEEMPAGSTKGYDADNWMRSNWKHLDNAWGIEHYAPSNDPDESEDDYGRHDYITLKQRAAKPDLTNSTNRHAIYPKSGGLYWEEPAGTETLLTATVFPSGTKVWFYADAAPTGWTLDATPSDELLAVKGGAVYTTGAAVAGTAWGSNTHTHTSAAHLHAKGTLTMGNASAGENVGAGAINGTLQAHTHTIAGSTASTTPGATGTKDPYNTTRPRARVGIICSKD
jgi:hypothetical protein